MHEPAALPLGQTDNLGSASLFKGHDSEEYGLGQKMPISLSLTCQEPMS